MSSKGLSFISNRQRRKEGTFCASGLAGIEPTPARPNGAGYACLNLSATADLTQFIISLAVSGSTLVGGSSSNPHSHTEEYEALVWDLETLEPLHTLRQPAGDDVCALASDGGEVWAASGRSVVVWGRSG